MIEKLPDNLLVTYDGSDGKHRVLQIYLGEDIGKEPVSYSKDLIAKINELVDVVNELEVVQNDKSIS